MGSYRFMFAFATSLAIQSVTLLAVSALGDTAEAWRTVAIVYAIIGLIVNTLSVFSVKELPEEEFVDTTDKAEIEKDEKYGLVEAAKLLVSNKYYLMICVTYILQQIYAGIDIICCIYIAIEHAICRIVVDFYQIGIYCRDDFIHDCAGRMLTVQLQNQHQAIFFQMRDQSFDVLHQNFVSGFCFIL